MSKTRVNYKSDLPPVEVSFSLGRVAIPVPANIDFALRFFVDGSPGESYMCGRKDGHYYNCEQTDTYTVTCYIDHHRLGCGRLCVEFISFVPNEKYSDGTKKTVTPSRLNIVLVDGPGDESENIDASVMIDIETVLAELQEAIDEIDGKLGFYNVSWKDYPAQRTLENFNALLDAVDDGRIIVWINEAQCYAYYSFLADEGVVELSMATDGGYLVERIYLDNGVVKVETVSASEYASSADVTALGNRVTAAEGDITTLDGKFTSLASSTGASMVGYTNSSPGYVGKTKVSQVLDHIIETTPRYQNAGWFLSGSPSVRNFEDMATAINDGKLIVLNGNPASTASVVDSTHFTVSFNIDDVVRTYSVSKSGSTITVSSTDTTLQEQLVSGTNIKTINNQSLLGSGNITIQGGGGGIQFVVYEDYDEMVDDVSQPNGTIGCETENYAYYIFNQDDEVWVELSSKATDLTWFFGDVPETTATYNKLYYAVENGVFFIVDKYPAAVKMSEGTIIVEYTDCMTVVGKEITSAGQTSGGSRQFVTQVKSVNGSSMVGSGNVSVGTITGITMNGASKGTSGVVDLGNVLPPFIEVNNAAAQAHTIDPNTFYKFATPITNLLITLNTAVAGITNIYAFSFTAGADNPTISISPSVTIADAPDIHSGDYVEFNIMDGKAIAKVWSA